MSNLAMWSLIVGTAMPPLVATIRQGRWARWFRATVMLVSSIVAGLGTSYFENSQDFNSHNWIQASLVVGVATIAAYHGFWKPTTIAPKIESATTLPKISITSGKVTQQPPTPPTTP